MNARQKLNAVIVMGCLIAGALSGIVFNSMTAFVLVTAVLIFMSISTDDIRFRPRR